MKDESSGWTFVGLSTLPIRFVQGWIFWGGGSRRFIYDPTKLDPHAKEWMANKLQSAMPGAIWGVSHVINFLLQHFVVLYTSIIIFSLVELVSGLGLMFGCFTRFFAFTTMLISILLMLAFGWQGATCMDEWTMAVATLAMGFTLTLSGAPVYSIDSLIVKNRSRIAKKKWFRYFASGPISLPRFRVETFVFLTFTVVFTLWTYNYYRGSIFTPYHAGPVSATTHHISFIDGKLAANGEVTTTIYVDGGTPALPSHIIRAELLDGKNKIVMAWNSEALSLLPSTAIHNEYDYNQVTTSQYGLVAPLSAKATITLSPTKKIRLVGNGYQLVLFTINGNRFHIPINVMTHLTG